ncbi:MAG: hypothetical protein JRN39_07975, partial [Nitrososphaerota archaeon]|nr:hypothetical protein [Nitrososphaerota archaeon]
MNRALVSLGAFFLALGLVMPQLLGELMTVTFRAAIPPWLAVSLPLAVLGGALALAGGPDSSSRPRTYLEAGFHAVAL